MLFDWRTAMVTSPNPFAFTVLRIAAVPGSMTTQAEFQPR
jgi:hypothetical protein